MKNLIVIFCLSFVAAFVTFSCQKAIEIKTDKSAPKYVVEGTIDIAAVPRVILSKTGFVYEPINKEALEEAYVHGAKVSVSDGVKTTMLSEVCYKNYDFFITTEVIDSLASLSGVPSNDIRLFLASLSNEQMDSLVQSFGIPKEVTDKIPLVCVYSKPSDTSFVGEAGKTYTLQIEKDGDVLTSSTTIPEALGIDSLTYEYNSDYPQYAQVYINISFDPGEALGNYVKFGSRKQDEGYYYGMLGGSVYSDAAFAGATNLTLPLEARKIEKEEERPDGTRRLFEKGDTAFLLWRNIDRATYNFLFTLENDAGASPFSSPTKIESNINGGLGLWGGFNTREYKVYIP